MAPRVSHAARTIVTKVSKEKDLRVLNATTARTIEKSERGEDLYRAKNTQDLFRQLGFLSRKPVRQRRSRTL